MISSRKFINKWSSIKVSKPDVLEKNYASGKGWELKLADGWKIMKGKENYRIVKVGKEL